MRRGLPITLCLLLMLLLITSCAEQEAENDAGVDVVTPQELTATELRDLGGRFLSEGNYEKAIIHLLKLIETDPTYEDGFDFLASAYIRFGEAAKAQGVLEMNYLLFPENEVALKRLLDQVVENGDIAAMGRIITGMQLTNSFDTSIVNESIQSLINTGNAALIKELADILNEAGSNETALTLILELWILSTEDHRDEEALSDEIISRLKDRQLPQLDEGEELFIGEHDDNGRRSGFGIAIFGEDVKINSIFYIGQWIEDQRSGFGIAFDASNRYIMGQWSNDLPNGSMTYSFEDWDIGGIRISDFSDGRGYGVIYTYNHDGSLQHIGGIAQTDVIQTFVPQPELFGWKNNEDEELREGCDCTHLVWDAPVPLALR